MIRLVLISVAVGLTSGCSTLKENFENRISITLSGDAVFVNSMYGPLGVTSKISDKDKDALVHILGGK